MTMTSRVRLKWAAASSDRLPFSYEPHEPKKEGHKKRSTYQIDKAILEIVASEKDPSLRRIITKANLNHREARNRVDELHKGRFLNVRRTPDAIYCEMTEKGQELLHMLRGLDEGEPWPG